MERAEADPTIRRFKRVGTVVAVLASTLTLLTSIFLIVRLVFNESMKPFRERLVAESKNRSQADKAIVEKIEAVGEIIVTPDSTARAILMRQVTKPLPDDIKIEEAK